MLLVVSVIRELVKMSCVRELKGLDYGRANGFFDTIVKKNYMDEHLLL